MEDAQSASKDMMSNPKVRAHFQTLDLDVHEGAALFHILDNGDGEALFAGGRPSVSHSQRHSVGPT